MPLNALTIMLWVQLAVVVIRHVPLFIGADGEALNTAGAGNLHFGIAAVFALPQGQMHQFYQAPHSMQHCTGVRHV